MIDGQAAAVIEYLEPQAVLSVAKLDVDRGRTRMLEGVLHRLLRNPVQMIAHLELDVERRIVTGVEPHRRAAQ